MAEAWEETFNKNRLIWGLDPARSAIVAKDYFVQQGVKDVLIPGVGYGRNAKVLLDNGMNVSGIEISDTAISLALTHCGAALHVHHGSVADMPYDRHQYDGIFCYGLLYLLDPPGRAKLLRDCFQQLKPGGHMIFTVIAKNAPMYGRGKRLGDDWYETAPGVQLYFYDANAVMREFGDYGLVEHAVIDEPTSGGGSFPFINVFCKKN